MTQEKEQWKWKETKKTRVSVPERARAGLSALDRGRSKFQWGGGGEYPCTLLYTRSFFGFCYTRSFFGFCDNPFRTADSTDYMRI